jgi:hypothetical protein
VKSRQQWTLTALVFAAAGSWWLTASDDGDAPPAAPEAPGQPGYYLRDAKLEQTDDDGRVYLRITTERAAEFGGVQPGRGAAAAVCAAAGRG